LEADIFVIATDTDGVYLDWGTPEERRIEETTPSELAWYSFPAGSMGPKVEAACHFVGATGHRAAIGALKDIEQIVAGDAGTQVLPD
jgi:carbamate kinase